MNEEKENVVVIHVVIEHVIRQEESFYQKRLRELGLTKEDVQRQIREAANNPEIQADYLDPEINLDLPYRTAHEER